MDFWDELKGDKFEICDYSEEYGGIGILKWTGEDR